ncbi:AraC family transcriptional regulator [Faecalicatena acetigenes]|uniref:AraC family transcriptional regulator n=1 Tax=Faecalicatena acetigenes TaxID=2981790 RepID=A0ABT2TCI9_9FIRM|nr:MULTISPECIES: AraC family transcriptional regulator [Lachnospiraceae]MCU6747990.1 AraC family transcriptional regulator [Faecalicatena acetigenes]SCI21100.1 Bacillibactin transport regulator [uncultured Clostridium sp.]
MDKALFLSQADVYNGHYCITKRDASHEFTKELHYHDFYEVQFYLCETANGIIGDIMINGQKRTLMQGCLVLINMFDPHQIHITCKEPYTRYCISFDSSLLLFACSENTNLFNIFSGCADVKYSRPLTPEQIKAFVTIYNKHESLNVQNGRDILEKAMILEVFAHIYDIFYTGQEISSTDSRSMEVVTKLIGYIDAHIAEDLSLETLSEYVSFSTFHLSRMFKRYTGTTLNKYIINKRIDKAKLLLKGPMSITAVSKEVGFNNYNHFYRTFKNVTGTSPADYKESKEKEISL